MAQTESLLEELENLVNKYKNNIEKVEPKQLYTRYEKSLNKLKGRISAVASEVFPDCLLSGLPFMPGDSFDLWVDEISQIVNKAKDNGYPKKLGAALIKYCSIELYLEYILRLRYDIEEQCYIDYWLSHTEERGGIYYNEIIDQCYDPEHKIWKNKNSFGVFLPPTREGCLEVIAKNKADLDESIIKHTADEQVIKYRMAG